jgi:hypothetical protein
VLQPVRRTAQEMIVQNGSLLRKGAPGRRLGAAQTNQCVVRCGRPMQNELERFAKSGRQWKSSKKFIVSSKEA